MPSQRDGTMAQAPAQVQDSWVDDVFVLFPGVNSNSSFPLLSCAGDSWDGSYPDLQSSTKFMMQWSSVRNIQSVSVCFSFRFLPFIPLVQMYALYLQATHLSNPFNIFSVTLCHSVTVFKKLPARPDLKDTHTKLCPHQASVTSLPEKDPFIPFMDFCTSLCIPENILRIPPRNMCVYSCN